MGVPDLRGSCNEAGRILNYIRGSRIFEECPYHFLVRLA